MQLLVLPSTCVGRRRPLVSLLRLVLLALTGAGACVATPGHALQLHVGVVQGPRLAAATQLAARLPMLDLAVTPTATDALALAALHDFALVRAPAARAAYQGTGRIDHADKRVRTVAVLGREVVHIWVRPGRTKWAELRGRAVAVAAEDADTLRAVLALTNLGIPDFVTTAPADPAEAARAGSIDAWVGVGLADSATSEALAAQGWQRLPFESGFLDRMHIEGWPLQVLAAGELGVPHASKATQVIAVPVVLIAAESVPRAVVEDAVDALFPTRGGPAGTGPLLADATRETAARPVPTPLHPGAAASFSRAGPLDGPIEVQVTTWLLDVSHIDVVAGTYDADISLELRWQDARLDPSDGQLFDIANAAEVHLEPLGYWTHGPWHAMDWRIKAKLRGHFDLHRYPFDRQRLTVELENPLKTADELIYHCETRFGSPDVDLRRDRLGPDLKLPDWRIVGVHSEEQKMTYGPGEQFNRYRFVVEVERALLPFWIRELGPILLMVLLALAGSLIPAEKIDAKMLLTVLALLVTVELQVAHDDNAPEFGYATLTEYLYLFAYLSQSVGILHCIMAYRYHALNDEPAADRVTKWGTWVAGLVFAVPTLVAVVVRW